MDNFVNDWFVKVPRRFLTSFWHLFFLVFRASTKTGSGVTTEKTCENCLVKRVNPLNKLAWRFRFGNPLGTKQLNEVSLHRPPFSVQEIPVCHTMDSVLGATKNKSPQHLQNPCRNGWWTWASHVRRLRQTWANLEHAGRCWLLRLACFFG